MDNRLGHRIIILGCPGSGKSTLAKELRAYTGLPLIHLDNVWWRADRTHISREEFDVRLREIMRGEEWIIDGNYNRTIEVRITACDTVIFLDYDEEECMNGITERVGKERDDIPWTEDRLDPELVEMVMNYRNVSRPKICGLLEKYPDKRALIFRTRAEADEWLSAAERNDRTASGTLHGFPAPSFVLK